MAYLTFTAKEETNHTCFKFIGTDSTPKTTNLISNNSSLLSTSNESSMDTCSFYSGPSDASILAFGESSESCGAIAFSGSESCGAIASSSSFSSGTCSFGGSTSGGSSSGGCSYSC